LESLTPQLGMLPTLEEIAREVQLVPGDWLLVFSDGVTEAANQQGTEFGEEGLLLAFDRASTRGGAEACESVIREVRTHLQEQRQPDDITLIAMKVLD
jgi:sigma-B regulation protein RsbU (phosphoserine phosphatase)